MKKLVTAIVVGVVMTVMSVVPCFAAEIECLTGSFGDTSESYDTPSTDVTVETTTPIVTTPATTAVASLAQQAQLIATNYVVATFYNGDINAASADMTNFMNYYNACYPNIIQGLQQK